MVTKLTANQQAWKKELKRLHQFIRRAEKRGYSFPSDVIPETPARITKKQLSKMGAVFLLKKIKISNRRYKE